MKTITLNVKGASQGQWSTFVLELNIMKRMWKSYGIDIDLKTHSLKRIIAQGTNNGSDNTKRRTVSINTSNR